jgi:hypothetical protein
MCSFMQVRDYFGSSRIFVCCSPAIAVQLQLYHGLISPCREKLEYHLARLHWGWNKTIQEASNSQLHIFMSSLLHSKQSSYFLYNVYWHFRAFYFHCSMSMIFTGKDLLWYFLFTILAVWCIHPISHMITSFFYHPHCIK